MNTYIENANYLNDRRVRAGEEATDRGKFDEKAMTLTYELTIPIPHPDHVEESEVEVEFPAKYEVCDTCDGKGSHVNPSIDASGLSREDFDEDPDFREEYMGGTYNVSCYGCGGVRVVPVVDESRADPAMLKILRERDRDLAAWRAESRAERMRGA